MTNGKVTFEIFVEESILEKEYALDGLLFLQ